MTKLDIMVLANTHASTHTYLEYLHAYNYEVKHILNISLVAQPKPEDNVLLFKLIGYKRKLQNYFKMISTQISNQQLCLQLQRPFKIKPDHFKSINFKKYSKDVQKITISSMYDIKLYNYLKQHSCKTLFFSASGMISEDILSIAKLKVIHIHPGLLPQIRGSDGILWSLLQRNKIGMSCFYMDKGIDTGEIIQTQEYALLKLDTIQANTHTLYEALLTYYEPHFRAKLLIKVIQNYKNLAEIDTTQQKNEEGTTYYTMHQKLKDHVISTYFLGQG